eukprot:CAMPEP_0197244722 /NCGR_PEP_ID=MMETSP1429-20130617/9756_1 /TAXON_ID=49237 /ORGANISM="Chaetoceros  sp., Strain UNC1202" /LENGTH=68 /DNA_ID=CAMNT_0042705125 /DNA_START=84 /DNA_END=290 /DNA_ORIENTATION=-
MVFVVEMFLAAVGCCSPGSANAADVALVVVAAIATTLVESVNAAGSVAVDIQRKRRMLVSRHEIVVAM